jgi:hypothetical protein
MIPGKLLQQVDGSINKKIINVMKKRMLVVLAAFI